MFLWKTVFSYFILRFIFHLWFSSIIVQEAAMGYSQKSYNLVWQCRMCHVSLVYRLVRWSWGLCSDLLAFTLQLNKTQGNLNLQTVWLRSCDLSLPQMGSFMTSVGCEGEGSKEGKDQVGSEWSSSEISSYWSNAHGTYLFHKYL